MLKCYCKLNNREINMEQELEQVVITGNTSEHKRKGINWLGGWKTRVAVVMVVLAVATSSVWYTFAATTSSSLWSANATPKVIDSKSSSGIELGMKFQSKYAGVVTGIRFYKGAQNTGTHTGSLWDNSGHLLARLTFTNETASGWQTATLAQPISIAANVLYTVSYHAPNGHYSYNTNYFANHGYSNGALSTPVNRSKHPNGVYSMSNSPTYPTVGFHATNFWVDVVFANKVVNPVSKPAPPTGVQAAQNGNKVVISWLPASSAHPISAYKIIRNGSVLTSVSGNTSQYIDSAVTAGQTYAYQIETEDNTNSFSDPSTTATITYNVIPPAVCPQGQTGTPPNCIVPPTSPTPPPIPVPTPGGGTTGGSGGTTPTPGSWWKPGTGSLPWQWEIDHEIVMTQASDAGTNSKTYTGAAAAHPTVYDVDGFDNTAADVASIHSAGAKAICYIEVGALENYRSDYSSFPASVIGKGMQGYSAEKYININSPTVLSLIENRIAMCHSKGFDAVEPDIDDSYTDSTGFTISETNEVQYLTKLSDYAHSLGLAWSLKNGGDGGTPNQFVTDMMAHIDFAIIEEPYYLTTIPYFYPALYNAGKAFFVAEYTGDTKSASSFCPAAIADHTNAALFDLNLDGKTRVACQ
jgi:hypothetical protein